ncbi:hypothetical protein BKA57DRAFT_476226, partial [Linnemannia elongata]
MDPVHLFALHLLALAQVAPTTRTSLATVVNHFIRRCSFLQVKAINRLKPNNYVSLEITFLLPFVPFSLFESRRGSFVSHFLLPFHPDTEDAYTHDSLPTPTRPSFLVSRQPNVEDNYIQLTFLLMDVFFHSFTTIKYIRQQQETIPYNSSSV